MPDHESNQVRSAWSARSYEGMEHPANPSAATRSRPHWSSTQRRYPGVGASSTGLTGVIAEWRIVLVRARRGRGRNGGRSRCFVLAVAPERAELAAVGVDEADQVASFFSL